jgi:hypothetical protein
MKQNRQRLTVHAQGVASIANWLRVQGKISDICAMSLPQSPITPEGIGALPPEFAGMLRAVIDPYERRLAALEAELAEAKETPRNSSLPPSIEHPHATADSSDAD